MNEERNDNDMDRIGKEETQLYGGAPRWMGFAMVALAAVSILALGVGWNATTHAKDAEQALAAQSRGLQQSVDTLNQRLAQAEGTNAQVENELSSITDRLKMAQGEMTTARRQSSQIREDYSKKIDNVQSELATKASADDVKSLGDDVNGVKSNLDATNNGPQMTRGEFGTLIAKNHDEIDQLRRLGERDYFEFTLAGKSKREKVGNLMIELRNTNQKKNQFTVALYVDDLRLEKRNRSVDEPIYFYTRGTRVPMEMVVNEVGKDKIVGYVSAPKAQATTASASVPTNN